MTPRTKLCHDQSVRLMTWNLWWKFGPWEERQDPILDEIRRVDADVVSLQEVWATDGDDQAQILADKLEYNVVRSVTADGSAQHFGNAVLSRHPLTLLAQLDLPGADGAPTARTALIVKVDRPPAPRLVVNTHLDWLYHASATRQAQLQAIVDAIDHHRETPDPENPLPSIITGDLNGQPESQEIRRLTGLDPGYHPSLIFIDCWAAVGDGSGHTWTRDNPNAAEASWPRRRLDYVLVNWPRKKPFCSPLSARLAGLGHVDESTGRREMVPSDHYAVVVELDDERAAG